MRKPRITSGDVDGNVTSAPTGMGNSLGRIANARPSNTSQHCPGQVYLTPGWPNRGVVRTVAGSTSATRVGRWRSIPTLVYSSTSNAAVSATPPSARYAFSWVSIFIALAVEHHPVDHDPRAHD